jgi:hypothetical protein
MAVCPYCDQEMLDRVACTDPTYSDFPDRVARQRIPHPLDAGLDCHDCAVPPGGLHHPGCDAERCPACGEQAISCGCTGGMTVDELIVLLAQMPGDSQVYVDGGFDGGGRAAGAFAGTEEFEGRAFATVTIHT